MLVSLKFPPGLYRIGTEYQSAGRFYDANLWRWYNGKSGPVGGWSALGSGITGLARGIHTWLDLSAVGRLALATNAKMYVVSTAGTATEVTPAGFSSANADTSQWSIDNAGQQIFLVNDELGTVYTWVPDDAEAAALTNAPTAAACFVTSERMLMILGAGGDPRLAQWSDLEGYTVWTPSTTNFTRDFPVQSAGELMCGAVIRGGHLVWSTEDLHMVRYIQRPLVYSFEPAGENCGIISRNGFVVADDRAWWMGKNTFYTYAGGVSELPCDVLDDVFSPPEEPTRGINRTYESKVYAVHMSASSEIWWHFPQGSATENNKVVVYNYRENHWNLHDLVRLCGTDQGNGFQYPLMLDASGGIQRHEIGQTRTGAGDIYARSGPLELGDGEQTLYGSYIYPDEGSAGDVETYVHTRLYPNDTETANGPYAAANPSGCMFAGRQASIEHRLADTDAGGKVGTFRVKVMAGGLM